MGGVGGGARASRPLWPPPTPPSHPAAPPLLPMPMPMQHDGMGRFGVYSVFPAGSHAPSNAQRFTTTSATHFHKVSESLFSAAAGSYAMGGLGAPTPPPGSPYSPLHLEVVNTFNHHNANGILIEQQQTESVQAFKKLDETKFITSRQQQQQCFTSNPVSIAACCGPGDIQSSDRCWEVRPDVNSNGIHPLTIKTENITSVSKKPCNSCVGESPKKTPHFLMTDSNNGGCSRTNPLTWGTTLPISSINNPSLQVQVKREPQLQADAIVKLEQNSPTGCAVTKLNADLSHLPVTTIAGSISNGSIPVGIAVARQRPPHELGGAGATSAGLLSATMPSHGKDLMPRFAEIDGVGGALVGVAGGLGSAPGDDSPWNPAQQQQPSAALWQYPPQMAVESMVGLGALGGLGGIGSLGAAAPGLQLVRDPNGTLLFIPAPEQYQQAVVWGPGYGGMGAGVILPPPLAPLQFLGAELLTASTTLHQHTSTRLVARTAPPAPPPALALPPPRPPAVKTDERPPPEAGFLLYQLADCGSGSRSPSLTPPPEDAVPPDVQDASNQTDTPTPSEEDEIDGQSVDCGVDRVEDVKHFSSSPRKILVGDSEIGVGDRAPQFSTCDSSVQTKHDLQIANECSESSAEDAQNEKVIKFTPKQISGEPSDGSVTIVMQVESFVTHNGSDDVGDDIESISEDAARPSRSKPSIQVDLSGLELLSNSIEQFETRAKSMTAHEVKPLLSMPSLDGPSGSELNVDTKNSLRPPPVLILKTSPKSPTAVESESARFHFPPNEAFKSSICEDGGSLGGLNLLCALAEQRFREEEEERRSEHDSVSAGTYEENHDDSGHFSGNIKIERMDRNYTNKPTDAKNEITDNRIFESSKFKINTLYEESPNHREPERSDSDSFQRERERVTTERRRSLERKLKENFSVRTSGERKSFDKLKRDFGISSRRRSSDKSKCRSSATDADTRNVTEEPWSTVCGDFAECSCKRGEAHTCEERSSWMSKMNRLEQDMILKLEDLQRQYREQQIELNKLTTKKSSEDSFKRGPGRPRKKSTASDKVTSPALESRDSLSFRNAPAPGIFTSSLPGVDTSLEEDCVKIPNARLRLAKMSEDENSSANDLSRESLVRSVSPVADSTSSQSSAATFSSSKKRKVGRPKKLLSAPGTRIATETIVAKKPKSKSSLVGYLLAAKRLNLSTNKGGIIYSKTNPPRTYEDEVVPKKVKSYKGLKLKADLKPVENCYSSPASSVSEYKYPVGYDVKQKYASLLIGESNSGSKMRPKLKAEPKLKDYSEEDEVNNDWCGSQSNLTDVKSQSSSMESLQEVHLKNKQKTDQLALKHKKVTAPKITLSKKKREFKEPNNSSDSEDDIIPKKRRMSKAIDPIVNENCEVIAKKPVVEGKCALLLDQIGSEDVRVLTAMGGLFYAGVLRAVRAPDVYAVTLDRERGNRPHILSREEALRDTILEVVPPSTAELTPGTRLCAYWSQQYRCLYPGTAARPTTPDPLSDAKFVPVEFDDGDSGRIAIEDIRLLQPDYPIVEYDLNPLLTLSKRRRQTSANGTDEKKTDSSVCSSHPIPVVAPPSATLNIDASVSALEQSRSEADPGHRERRRLKKCKREKLKRMLSKSGDENADIDDRIRKKKKKHKCCDDHCKHRKHHKKHHRKRKRRRRSGSKERSESSSEDPVGGSPLAASCDVSVEIPASLPRTDNVDTPVTTTKSDSVPIHAVVESPSKKRPAAKKTLQKFERAATRKIVSAVNATKKKETSAKSGRPKKQNSKDSGVGLDVDDVDGPSDSDEDEDEDEEQQSVGESPDTEVFEKKAKKRSSSCASEGGASKMAAFLPAGAQLWGWGGTGHKRRQSRGRARKCFYRTIQRANEVINVGDSAVFLSTGRPDRPYIGQVESMWEGWQGNMAVKVRWYYHPEETVGCPGKLACPGGLFESPHTDENDVQTISHRCEVLPFSLHRRRAAASDTDDAYYLAGKYDPTRRTLTLRPDVPLQGRD